jgi:UDP-N-acetyl-D-mannosaminuronate dehydrogenase
LALDGFDPILEVINKGLEDDDLVMLESSPVANTKNVIEKTIMEKNTKKQRTNFYQQ